MTYSTGGLIQAADFNGFAGPTASGGTSNANLNDFWGAGSGDKGWGQTAIGTVSTGGTVAATNWASLVNTLSSAGSQTGTSLTARTAPTVGTTISILSALNTDLSAVNTNRGFAAAVGTTSSTWTGSTAKTTATGSGQDAWTITWAHTVTFPSADQARYFWNAGGRVQMNMSKTSTGTDADPDWNTFSGYVGSLYLSGRVNGAAQTIGGTSYTGFTRIGGTGGTQSVLATTTGWYNLTGTPTTMLTLFDTTYPYTGNFIRVTMTQTSSTVLTISTVWSATARVFGGISTNISGGTDTASPFTTFGTAPAVLVRYIPPSTTYLTNSWGTPAVAAVSIT
jgi:hypothetical protein